MRSLVVGCICVYAFVAISRSTGFIREHPNGIRLVGGNDQYEGRVEIFYLGVWSTVCDDNFYAEAANVLCRMLGFTSATSSYCCSKFGQGSGENIFSNVYCEGHEANISECRYRFYSAAAVSSSDSKYSCDHSEDVALVCDPGNVEINPFDIRLVGGETPFDGRVEIYNEGSWATVCDKHIRIQEANVLCRMLGHTSASSYHCCAEFGRGVGDNMMRDIQCEGSEFNITDCEFNHLPQQPYEYSSSDGTGEYCDHSDDLGLVCIPGEVRIRNGSKRLGHQKGRVELLQGHKWKAFCAESMDLNLAIVLCRMLGEHTAKSYYDMELLDNEEGAGLNITYVCQGNEDSVAECEEQSRAAVNCCRDQRIAGISCASLPARLVSKKENEGRVEVYHGRSWSAICSTSWNIHAANVICRMLGYTGASSAFRDEELLEAPSASILYESIECNGAERNVAHCNMSESRRGRCDLDGYAAARCAGEVEVPMRLVGGADFHSGRVELFYYGSWGTVCAADDLSTTPTPHYALNIANVICRMLGFPRALSYECCGHYGQGLGGIFLDTLKCTGKEANILECPRSDQGLHRRCHHFMDLGVTCQENVDYRIRLVGGASKLEGRVEVKSDSSWGTICDDNWDLTDSNVVCRMLGYERAESYFSCEKYEVNKRKQIILDEVECDGTEANIGHCRVQHWHDCTHDEDVGVKCVDWKTGISTTTLSSSTKAADVTGNLASYNEATTKNPSRLPARKTFALVISQVVYILLALIVIVLLTIRMQLYRRRAVEPNVTEIPLTGTEE